ncbi:uncharacterized protein LOC124148145 isoform X1 [Haliotis rufescens]|uniref:uncharacterized protein LOC124148145 isoform X1 n=1 Tax=Haliotis rufescens TaxID=6454 RepID=UPI00201EE344|nr:uncharacterized protein LOC124148145 isoform X1 [Haliotis rufescens]
MEVVDIKRRSEGREERRRRRRERRLRRMQEGLQPNGSDSDSSDSGYSGRSTTSLFRPEDGHGEHEDEERKSPEKKTRRVFDDEGNLLYEQEIPRSSDQEEEEDDEGGKRVKQKTKKKTRKYTKMKTLPDGTEVKEVIESDHWSTDSEKSSHSWTQDHVDLHLAKQRRDKEHQSMVERSTGSNTKTLVTRPSHEKNKLNATLPFSLPGIFKYLAKGKRKLPEAPPGEEETPREADRYMEQYQDKKDTERRLDDEGFWEDPKSKKTALEIFDFDNLDSQLDESPSRFHTALDNTAGRDQHQDGVCSRLSRHTAQSTESKNQTLPDIERPSSLVTGSDGTCDEMSVKSSDTGRREHEKTRMLASLSRLLTERLFYDDEADRKSTRAQSGKVIFVDEYRTQTPASQLPSRSKSRGSQSLLRHSHHAFGETGSDNMNEPEGNLRPGSQGVELPPLKRSGYSTPRHTPRYTPRFTPHGKRRLGPDKAAALKYGLQQDRGYLMYLLRGPWPTREAWTGQPPDRNGRPWTVQRGAGGNNIRDTNDIDYTTASGDIGYVDIDDARLKRLLEELYGDKKYMDALLAAEETSSNEEVKALAEHGRDYLVQMALYWEEKGPLPPRPSVTALGFRMERAKTACLQSSKEAKIPTLQRNKTMD